MHPTSSFLQLIAGRSSRPLAVAIACRATRRASRLATASPSPPARRRRRPGRRSWSARRSSRRCSTRSRPQGNGQWTAMIVGPALARGYKLMPDFSYEPWLFDKDCTVTDGQPVHGRLHDPPRREVVRQRAASRRRLQVHVRHDHEHEERRRHARRLRQDHRVQRASAPPNSRWCSRRCSRPSASSGPARPPRCCRSTCSRVRTSTRSGTAASATRRPRSRSAAARCSCSRSRPTSRPRSSRTRTTGGQGGHRAEGRVRARARHQLRAQRLPRR